MNFLSSLAENPDMVIGAALGLGVSLIGIGWLGGYCWGYIKCSEDVRKAGYFEPLPVKSN